MAKFDIFNKSTWQPAVQDVNAIIDNKAIGAIGQKISVLRSIKEDINNNVQTENKEYTIAQQLSITSPEAYRIMGVRVEYPENGIGLVLKDIDFILQSWTEKSIRQGIWRSLVPALERLKPYLDDKEKTYASHHDALRDLTQIKVTGNKAWECYLSSTLMRDDFQRMLQEDKKNSPYDDSPESHDYDEEDES